MESLLVPRLRAPVIGIRKRACLEFHEHVVAMEQRRLVVRQEIAPRSRLLGRHIGVVDDVGQGPVQVLAGDAHESLVLWVLPPLEPVDWPRSRDGSERQTNGDDNTGGKRRDTES
jgi:hypothetical protein